MKEKIETMQKIRKKWNDKSTKLCSFIVGSHVSVLNFGSGPKWLPGKVTGTRSPVSVTIELAGGRSMSKHYDHILAQMLMETETFVQKQLSRGESKLLFRVR